MLVAITTLSVGAGPADAASAVSSPAESINPADIVVLVDESSNLTPPGFADEAEFTQKRDAVELLLGSELSPDSHVAVVGFGSSPSSRADQAVDTVCPLRAVATVKADRDCLGRLNVRDAGEGNGADFVVAIEHALNIVAGSRAADARNIIYFLTDGGLDVGDSPVYGGRDGAPGVAEARNNEAQRRLQSEILPRAAREKVEIWPIGFGRQPDLGYLSDLAARSYRYGNACRVGLDEGPVAVPAVPVVDTTAELPGIVTRLVATARCSQVAGLPESPVHIYAAGRPEAVSAGDTVDVSVVVRGTTVQPDLSVRFSGAVHGAGLKLPDHEDTLSFTRTEDEWRALYQIIIDENAPPGLAGGEIQVIDTTSGRRVAANPLWFEVMPARADNLPLIIGVPTGVVAALAIVVAIAIRHSGRRSALQAAWHTTRKIVGHRRPRPASDVGLPTYGLTVWLFRDGDVLDYLQVLDPKQTELDVRIADDGAMPRLLSSADGRGDFRLRRSMTPGMATIRRGGNDWNSFSLNDPVERRHPVRKGDLEIEVVDRNLAVASGKASGGQREAA